MSSEVSLEDQSAENLRDQAREAGITGFSHMRKEELIKQLEAIAGSSKKPSPKKAFEEESVDAITVLKKDHAKVKSLFKKALSNEKEIGNIVQEILLELTLHTQVEENIFYPSLKEKSLKEKNDEVKNEVLEAYVEHASVKELMEKIEASLPSDESYKALVQVMSEQVEHHVEEEENEMFKKASKIFSEAELADLGRKILEMKSKASA